MRKHEAQLERAENAVGHHKTVFATQLNDGPVMVPAGPFAGEYATADDLRAVATNVKIVRITGYVKRQSE